MPTINIIFIGQWTLGGCYGHHHTGCIPVACRQRERGREKEREESTCPGLRKKKRNPFFACPIPIRMNCHGWPSFTISRVSDQVSVVSTTSCNHAIQAFIALSPLCCFPIIFPPVVTMFTSIFLLIVSNYIDCLPFSISFHLFPEALSCYLSSHVILCFFLNLPYFWRIIHFTACLLTVRVESGPL